MDGILIADLAIF